MKSEYKMNSSYTVSFAKELTIKAIENNLFVPSADPKETAKMVTDFYKQVLDTIYTEN